MFLASLEISDWYFRHIIAFTRNRASWPCQAGLSFFTELSPILQKTLLSQLLRKDTTYRNKFGSIRLSYSGSFSILLSWNHKTVPYMSYLPLKFLKFDPFGTTSKLIDILTPDQHHPSSFCNPSWKMSRSKVKVNFEFWWHSGYCNSSWIVWVIATVHGEKYVAW